MSVRIYRSITRQCYVKLARVNDELGPLGMNVHLTTRALETEVDRDRVQVLIFLRGIAISESPKIVDVLQSAGLTDNEMATIGFGPKR